ncbi:unnamed protein product [Adineta steineri]|uniref:Uncharacterized protein n=1 Tax=Adineta steineri TaxID=433720 RepID=A0A813NTS3_9BILA|nr:unnamed protein product [Adineta steineri]CAF0754452.1 unnamed protein product [Adineta steineri]
MDIEVLPSEFSNHEGPSIIIDSDSRSKTITTQKDPTPTDPYDFVLTQTTTTTCLPCLSRSTKVVIIFALFTSLSMMNAILTVYYTSAKPPSKVCTFILTSDAKSSIGADSHPYSVAVADLNNDGLLDIVVPNSGINKIGVFLRQANNTFADQMTFSTGDYSMPHSLAIADINNDQRQDIIVANFGTNNVGVFLGRPNGTFGSQTTFSTGSSRPRWVIIADFNNDTQPDIAVVNHGSNNIGILLGDGKGNFANQITFSTGFDSIPYSIAIADLNNDGKLDIAVANYGTNNVGVLLNYGNGTFATQVTFKTGINSHPSSIAINDLNTDNHMDIVVVCSGTNNIAILLGLGNGTFTITKKYSTGNNSSPRSIVIGDFDNDNILDIAAVNYGTVSIGVFFGYGTGIVAEQMTFFTASDFNPQSIATGYFNNDTRLDIVVVNFDYNYVIMIITNKKYNFLPQTTYRTTGSSSFPTSATVADFNNDNLLDMVVTNYYTNSIDVLINYGNDIFKNQVSYSTGSDSGPYYATSGDFNNDKRPDIAVANYRISTIIIFLANGNGTFSSPTSYSTGSGSRPYKIVTGDLNNDNWTDIVVGNDANYISIFLGYGDGTFSTQTTYSTGNYSDLYSVVIGDINNDKQQDIVVTTRKTSSIAVFLGYGDGKFSSPTTFSTGNNSGPELFTFAELNGDNLVDIVVADYDANNIRILYGYGNGSFSLQSTLPTGNNSSPRDVTIADIDKDGHLDIVFINYNGGSVGIFFGYGKGNFSTQKLYSLGNGSHPYSIVVSDLNNDGQSDIIIPNSGTGNVVILSGYDNSTFTSQQTYRTKDLSNPQSIAVGDVNNDKRLDVIVVNYLGNNVDIFLGLGNGTFTSYASYATGTSSNPHSVAVGHFNDDKWLDIVVANSGSNNIGIFLGYGNATFSSQTTYSTGNSSQPYAVAIADFNNDKRLDIVVANYGTNNLGIFYGNNDGTFLSQQTMSTGPFSLPRYVVVGDFNNDSRWDIAVINYGPDSLGIFLGYDNGTFSNQTTYFTGLGAGPYSAAVGDLNNDGIQDIIVTVYYSRAVAIFLGYGNGTFAKTASYSTGSGSRPITVAIGDLNNDNRMDIAVGNCYTDNVVIFIGTGDGKFSYDNSYSADKNACPSSIALGDFNNDTVMDIVVANYGTNVIGVFLGTTYITGIPEDAYSTGSSPHPQGVAIDDFNKDDQLDIVIVNGGLGNVGVLLGHSNGTFPLQTIFSVGDLSYPTSVVIADVNNDTELDIIVANSATESIGILYGYGNGSFANVEIFATGSGTIPQSIVVGDFNNDKKLDIVVASTGIDSVFIFLRYDPGAFRSQISYSTGTNSVPRFVTIGDFNRDGRLDFAVANAGAGSVGVFIGLGNNTFSSQTTYLIGSQANPQSIISADLNKDGCLDLVVCSFWGNYISIFFGRCDGTFLNQTNYQTGDGSGPYNAAVGDFNNDTQLDIVITLQFTNQIGFFYGYKNGTFSNVTIFSVEINSYPVAIAAADLNYDSRLDIAVVHFGGSYVGIFYGFGNGTFSNMIKYSTGINSLPRSIVIVDLNKNGRLDIVVANSGTDNVGIFYGNNNGTFSNMIALPTGSGSGPTAVAVVDINNDAQLDIVVANYGNNNFGVLLGCVNGTFFRQLTYSTGDYSEPCHLAVCDFDNDNRMDVVVVNSGSNSLGVFFGYVSDSFLSAPTYLSAPSSHPTSIAYADFNNDNQMDVVVTNNGADNIMILFGSGYGTFISQMTYSTGMGSQPSSVAVEDLNKDGRLDIVVTNSGTNNIVVFLGNNISNFSNPMTYSTGLRSQPNAVAIVDFDNDGQLDIAIASYGANSMGVFLGYGNGSFMNQLIFPTGFGSHPIALATGDINKDKLIDIVAVNDGYGNIDILMKTC